MVNNEKLKKSTNTHPHSRRTNVIFYDSFSDNNTIRLLN